MPGAVDRCGESGEDGRVRDRGLDKDIEPSLLPVFNWFMIG